MVSIREIQTSDIDAIIAYWVSADNPYLEGMGCDVTKMPTNLEWKQMLMQQISSPYEEKQAYCLIWLLDNKAIGHCNVNKIKYGAEAYMHLHLWDMCLRKKGLGTELVKRSLPYFQKNLKLNYLYCEPYAFNSAPNKALEKAGFTFVKKYRTIPGSINVEQEVNRWELNFNATT